ncbi:MAG TPA: glycosyltransferase family 39 protein [Granulicella sp.]
MNARRQAGWRGTAVALLAALLLRLWFVLHSATVAGDTLIYGEIARNWMQHGVYGFALKNGIPQPTLIRLPGYPMFLAACFRVFGPDSYTAVMIVQALVDLGTCLLPAGLAGRLFGRRARMAALWIGALCPFIATYTANALTETLTLFTIALCFYGFERWQAAGANLNRWLWVVALALSYGILLRPEQGLLAAAVVPAMLWIAVMRDPERPLRAVAPVLAASVCVLLPLVPWTLRNERTFHVFEPLAPRYATDPGELIPLGFMRWYRTWAIDFASTENVYWNYDGTPIDVHDLPDRAFDTQSQYERTAELFNAYNPKPNATAALDLRFDALASERIAANPIRYYVTLPVARLVNMLLRPRIEMFPIALEWWRWNEHPAQTAFALAYGALNLGYVVLAYFGFILWRRSNHASLTPLAASMLAFVLMRCALLLTMDNSEPRYTLEFFPIAFVLAAAVFARSSESLQRSSRSA